MQHNEKGAVINEFQLTLTNITAKRGTSVSDLARRVGYDSLFFEKIVTGKSRQVPADFFVQIAADALDLTTVEKDALVRSRAFGVERWNWPQTYERYPRQPVRRKAG